MSLKRVVFRSLVQVSNFSCMEMTLDRPATHQGQQVNTLVEDDIGVIATINSLRVIVPWSNIIAAEGVVEDVVQAALTPEQTFEAAKAQETAKRKPTPGQLAHWNRNKPKEQQP